MFDPEIYKNVNNTIIYIYICNLILHYFFWSNRWSLISNFFKKNQSIYMQLIFMKKRDGILYQ